METAKSNLVTALHRLPLFTDLTEVELALIAERVTEQRVAPGRIIFCEGDACSELFIVKEGRVKLVKTSANGRQQLLSIERAGNALSENPVFDGGRYPATAEAVTATTLLCLQAEHFHKICRQHPEVALKVIKALGHRLRRMTSLVEELSFSTVRGRLATHLVCIARELGRATDRGVELELAENNEELAARLGTVRELVSRNLGRLHNEGLIQMSRRKVLIPDLSALQNEAEGRRNR